MHFIKGKERLQQLNLHQEAQNLTSAQLRAAIVADEREQLALTRFLHPWTGIRIPEVVDFQPHSCKLFDDGAITHEHRGVLYYLSTGGDEGVEGFVNAADREAVVSQCR